MCVPSAMEMIGGWLGEESFKGKGKVEELEEDEEAAVEEDTDAGKVEKADSTKTKDEFPAAPVRDTKFLYSFEVMFGLWDADSSMLAAQVRTRCKLYAAACNCKKDELEEDILQATSQMFGLLFMIVPGGVVIGKMVTYANEFPILRKNGGSLKLQGGWEEKSGLALSWTRFLSIIVLFCGAPGDVMILLLAMLTLLQSFVGQLLERKEEQAKKVKKVKKRKLTKSTPKSENEERENGEEEEEAARDEQEELATGTVYGCTVDLVEVAGDIPCELRLLSPHALSCVRCSVVRQPAATVVAFQGTASKCWS